MGILEIGHLCDRLLVDEKKALLKGQLLTSGRCRRIKMGRDEGRGCSAPLPPELIKRTQRVAFEGEGYIHVGFEGELALRMP